MKPLIPCFWLVVASAALAAGPPLANFCEPLRLQGCAIVWAAPTNWLPQTVNLFKVVPTKYSPSTISNLLHLAELTEKNTKRPVQTGVFLGNDVLSYGDRKETRQLDIVPSEGFIVLTDSRVIAAAREPSHDVPSPPEALKSALRLLSLVGLKESDLATNRTGRVVPRSFSDETEMHRDKPSGRVVTNLLARSVHLNRQFEGIPVWGSGGVAVKFGNHRRVTNLTVTWRKVEAFRRLAVPSPAEFIGMVKTGKSLMRDGEARPFKSLTVTNALLYYWENEGSEEQKFIHPFAVLEAKAVSEGGNSRVEIFIPFAND